MWTCSIHNIGYMYFMQTLFIVYRMNQVRHEMEWAVERVLQCAPDIDNM